MVWPEPSNRNVQFLVSPEGGQMAKNDPMKDGKKKRPKQPKNKGPQGPQRREVFVAAKEEACPTTGLPLSSVAHADKFIGGLGKSRNRYNDVMAADFWPDNDTRLVAATKLYEEYQKPNTVRSLPDHGSRVKALSELILVLCATRKGNVPIRNKIARELQQQASLYHRLRSLTGARHNHGSGQE